MPTTEVDLVSARGSTLTTIAFKTMAKVDNKSDDNVPKSHIRDYHACKQYRLHIKIVSLQSPSCMTMTMSHEHLDLVEHNPTQKRKHSNNATLVDWYQEASGLRRREKSNTMDSNLDGSGQSERCNRRCLWLSQKLMCTTTLLDVFEIV